MGISPQDFDTLTPAEFVYARLAWMAAEREKFRQEWERTRWSTWILAMPNFEKSARGEASAMFPLPWEEASTQKCKEMTMEERSQRVNTILSTTKRNSNE
ncbi:MAG: hypothetical protein R3Y49_03080 [Rikenellaceae bacterium]